MKDVCSKRLCSMWLHSYEIARTGKSTEAGSGLMVRGNRESLLIATFFFRRWWKHSTTDDGNGFTAVSELKISALYILNKWFLWDLHHNKAFVLNLNLIFNHVYICMSVAVYTCECRRQHNTDRLLAPLELGYGQLGATRSDTGTGSCILVLCRSSKCF